MPSENQIEAGMRGWIDAITNAPENEGVHERRRRLVVAILTAAEQAEPAILPDDSLSAIISNIGNEIHNLACERQNDEDLSERLSDFRTRLWAIAQQAAIEPAPAALSGAVKVRKLEWETPTKADTLIGTYHIREGRARFAVMLDGISIPNPFRNTLDEAQAAAQADYERRVLAALEPAEPETDAEPVAWGEDIGGNIASVRMDKSRHCTIPLYTHPPESRLRDALEEIANGCDGRIGRDILPCRIARAALAQEDGR